MGKVILGTTISLDGYINDRSGSVSALYADIAPYLDTETLRELIRDTGAVVMGRNSFAMAENPDTFADTYLASNPLSWKD